MSNEFKPMKFGCGRYVQAPGAIEIVGREAAMLKSKKALIGFPLKKYIYIYTKSYENINLTDNIDKYNMQYCNNTVIVVHKPLLT